MMKKTVADKMMSYKAGGMVTKSKAMMPKAKATKKSKMMSMKKGGMVKSMPKAC